ncbi:MAG: amino acid permease [Sedimentisphaerales bacterium]|nr:amino acid permease [Sedimentisphaerales bacterium]
MTNNSSQLPDLPEHVPHGELARELTLFHITMMGLGMMIGAGIFLGMGISIGVAGPGGAILTFALNGLLAMFTAMSYAELSSAIPRAGGAYNFARVGFGRGSSFLAGWMEWFASSVAGSMYALTFAIYTVRFFEYFHLLHWLPVSILLFEKIVAVLTAGLFIYINFRGASETGKVGALITLGQTLFLLIIGIVGIAVAIKEPERLANFKPFMPNGWHKLLITMGFTYVAFEGYEVIAQAGDEALEPRKNLPKAMLYSVLIVTCIYVLAAFATIVSVKSSDAILEGQQLWIWIGRHQQRGFGEAVSRLMPAGNYILTLAVIFASTSALNATIYSATRASYALGRDRMLPRLFASIHKRRKTPYGALLGAAAIIIIVITVLPTTDVASSASIMFLFLFFMVNLCVIKIRRNMADELTYGFIMPLFPVFPVLAILCQVVLAAWLVHMSLLAWIIAPAWIITGLIMYHTWSKSRAITTADEILVLEERKLYDKNEIKEKYPIMVAVANPVNAASLVKGTYRLCGAKDAQVELIHMVPVPDQVSLHDAEKYSEPGKEAMLLAMRKLSKHFPISTTLRYCRSIARGIVSALRQKRVKMLVMGWHGRPSTSLFYLGATIDPIIERAPCNVVVLKDYGEDKMFKHVLVPLAGGPNGPLALEIAAILCDHSAGDGDSITVFTVDTGRRVFDLDTFIDEQTRRLHLERKRFQSKVVKSRNPVRAILDEAKNHDLVVMGTTQKPILFQFAGTSIPEIIARHCEKPIVMVKSDVGVRSWIKRWI